MTMLRVVAALCVGAFWAVAWIAIALGVLIALDVVLARLFG